MNLRQVLTTLLRSRILPLFTRLTLLFNPRYMLSRLTEMFRNLFRKVLDIRPRDKDDYYPVGGWLVSKRLAYAAVLVIALVCIIYIITQKDALFPGNEDDHISTYKYNSILLKYAKGKVRIKGKSGWLAYEGEVSNAACNGEGTLRNPQGVVVYEGNFASNMYEKEGTSYYPDGMLQYTGDFHENLYSGKGKLYRQTGSKEYEGDFTQGMKEGTGQLYDTGGNELFLGQFSQDEILYAALLGKTSAEMASAYSGKRKLYEAGSERIRFMEGINAVSEEIVDEASVDDSAKVSAIYVMDNKIRIGTLYYNTFAALEQALGKPSYVGDSYASLPELMIINRLSEETDSRVVNGPAEITQTDVYSEYTKIDDYDTGYVLYLHSYEKDGLVYNFVSSKDDDRFAFYYILERNLNDDPVGGG